MIYDMLDKKVNFFLVGAPKCGTTALVDYLSQHAEIFIPSIKEPHFFCESFPEYRRIKKLDRYHALYNNFKGDYVINGDSSVWYLYSQDSADNIYQYNPDAKIVIMLRNPIEMLPSLHTQLMFSGRENISNFDEAWAACTLRSQGYKIPKNSKEPSHLLYDEVCNYYDQVARYLKRFPRENVKIIFFDDFSESCQSVVQEVFQFLKVSDESLNIRYEIKNSARKHRYPKISMFLMNPPFPLGLIKKQLKRLTLIQRTVPLRSFYGWLSSKADKSAPSEQIVEEIVKVYSHQIKLLFNLVERDQDIWTQFHNKKNSSINKANEGK
jgi:hypothetical protein